MLFHALVQPKGFRVLLDYRTQILPNSIHKLK